jgi:hypothetical protein
MRHALATLLLAVPWSLAAQQTADVLRFAGEPLKVPFACAEDDLSAVGLLCTENEPCPIFLELSSVASSGRRLFLSGNLHATAGTISSIILMSDDAGLTWKETAKRRQGAAIDQIQFRNLELGWAAGEVQYPLTRDPFFLVTTDGGLSWRETPITEEGGPGAIVRFWFDSPQHGELIIDAGKTNETGRYLDYETETGGTSWMIRGSTGDMPKMSRAPAVPDPGDYRIRPVNNGKSYAIERQADEKWQPVAQFAIEAASCAIKAPEMKEPDVDSEKEAEPPKDYVEELHLGGSPAPKTAPKKAPPPKGKK